MTSWQDGNHSLRWGSWRYTRYRTGEEELYDHASDAQEWHNLVRASQLSTQQQQALAQLGRSCNGVSANPNAPSHEPHQAAADPRGPPQNRHHGRAETAANPAAPAAATRGVGAQHGPEPATTSALSGQLPA